MPAGQRAGTDVGRGSTGARKRPARRRDPEQVDQAVMDAARELLVEGGYARFTMQSTAQRAGTSSASLYRRYANRDELVVAVIAQTRPSEPPDTGSLAGDLRAFARRAARNLNGEGGKLLQALIGEVPHNEHLGNLLRNRLVAAGQAEVQSALERGVARGEISRPGDPALVRELIVGPLQHRTFIGETIRPEMVEALLSLVLRAIGWQSVDGGRDDPATEQD